MTSAAAPAGTVAQVRGRHGGAVFVIEDGGGRYRILAGHPENPASQISMADLDAGRLRGFADALGAHLAGRSGERPRVPYDEPFPAAVRLPGPGGTVMNVYDDGDDFSIRAVAGDSTAVGGKAGTGTGASVDDVRRFSAELTAAVSRTSTG